MTPRAVAAGARAPSPACRTGWSGSPKHDGVLFVNDSKATNPASTAPALAAFPPDPDTRIHWIVGGLPKGDDLDECAPHFGNVAAAYTIGEAGPRFAELLDAAHAGRQRCEMLCEAIRRGDRRGASRATSCCSRPACASFDQFRDYEARGEPSASSSQALTGGPEPPTRARERSAA